MSDWPRAPFNVGTVISSAGPNCMVADVVINTSNAFNTSAVWPSANRAFYIPFWINQQVTAYQMSFIVATQAGNYDVGIYDDFGHRLVSKGSTAVPAAGIGLVDITDTILYPGAYFMAMNCSSTTASFRRSAVGTVAFRAAGVMSQDVGATALPDPFTGAAIASAYCPLVAVHFRSVV